jgi:hypothetical protein
MRRISRVQLASDVPLRGVLYQKETKSLDYRKIKGLQFQFLRRNNYFEALSKEVSIRIKVVGSPSREKGKEASFGRTQPPKSIGRLYEPLLLPFGENVLTLCLCLLDGILSR